MNEQDLTQATCCCPSGDGRSQRDAKRFENCMVCGKELTYQTHPFEIACNYCGIQAQATVFCADGHYVCEKCHGADCYGALEAKMLDFVGKDAMEIAEILLQTPGLPSLGGEHHPIVAASLLIAVKNHGEVLLPDGTKRLLTMADVYEGIRRMKQIPSCTCAYHGTCGAGIGVGVFFSILFQATCAVDIERTISMRASNAALIAIANTGGPACCKQSVRTAVGVGVELLKEFCRVKLPVSRHRCFHTKETSHGCKGVYCQFI